MFNFCSLYSGSSGNSLFIESDKTKILVDCGVSCKKISEALIDLNTSLEEIDAIFVTHEHSDHVQSLGMISKKYDIPVYTNFETLNAMPKQKEKIDIKNQKLFCIGDEIKIGDLCINSFKIPHDAANPCGYNIFNNSKKLTIATDLGHMTQELLDNMKGSKFILLESNYEPELLKYAKYPYMLKQRIAGPTGHLPNSIAGKTISHLVNYDLEEVLLGHLSKESNMPEIAYQTVIEELHNNNVDTDKLKLAVASRDKHSKLIKIS